MPRPYVRQSWNTMRRRNHRHRSGFWSTVKSAGVSLRHGVRHPRGPICKRSTCNLRDIRRYLVGRFAYKRSYRATRRTIGADRLFVLEIFSTVLTLWDLWGPSGACRGSLLLDMHGGSLSLSLPFSPSHSLLFALFQNFRYIGVIVVAYFVFKIVLTYTE